MSGQAQHGFKLELSIGISEFGGQASSAELLGEGIKGLVENRISRYNWAKGVLFKLFNDDGGSITSHCNLKGYVAYIHAKN